MDLLTIILQKAEESNGPLVGSKMGAIPGYTPEQVYEHALLAQEQGLVEARFAGDRVNFTVLRLTDAGHEFLESHATAR
jgi:hypothetical protein